MARAHKDLVNAACTPLNAAVSLSSIHQCLPNHCLAQSQGQCWHCFIASLPRIIVLIHHRNLASDHRNLVGNHRSLSNFTQSICLLCCAGKAGRPNHGELLFSVLLEFWLTDGEEPSLKGPKDSRLDPALAYEAPTADMLEALQVGLSCMLTHLCYTC